MSAETLEITALAPKGDGVATGPKGPVFVPFTAPGDVVTAAINGTDGTLMALKTPSPDRIAPACRHFGPDAPGGACGGCTLQHVAAPVYEAFKQRTVTDALSGLTPAVTVAPLVTAAPGERRRLVLSCRRTEKGLVLGFNSMGSHTLVDIDDCPVALPSLVARLPVIRRIAAAVATGSETFKVTVLDTLTGLDLSFEGQRKLSEAQRRQAVDAVLKAPDVARVVIDGEILVEPRKPTVDFGGVSVVPPPAPFAQASARAEEEMVKLVLAHLGKAKRVADLFAGMGTFALRIARQARVHAVEGDEKAVKALDAAARATQGLKPVSVERRDLFRRPLMTAELKAYDALVFDPPRAGAEAQCREIARSTVKTIVAVSCNPATLARDLAILTAGGYRVQTVTPIDQFLWSTHVEAVATLTKG
ncbi:class I SAM-dependent RNA methyltransferase [Rhizobium sp. SG2393]|uniref:class I SAM-dependent RNA methyltransferase n=1 Tax=Rhizobium sp. SG2393 TaxID=3276279 RepID=UPI0036729A98